MSGRIIEIASPAKLSIRDSVLSVKLLGRDEVSVAIEDLSIVMLSNRQISVTVPALNAQLMLV